jgi:septum formation protein
MAHQSCQSHRTRRLILASSSPQRSAILTKIGLPFKAVSPEVDETAHDRLSPEKTARYLARLKAVTVAEKMSGSLVLGADTVVAIGRRMYGKPENEDEARTFLRTFSGRSHGVITALCLCDEATRRLGMATAYTRVLFSRLSDEMIDWYIRTGEWRGAAGGYRIQGQGARFVRSLMGLESTVIGLPVYTLMKLLAQMEQGT